LSVCRRNAIAEAVERHVLQNHAVGLEAGVFTADEPEGRVGHAEEAAFTRIAPLAMAALIHQCHMCRHSGIRWAFQLA